MSTNHIKLHIYINSCITIVNPEVLPLSIEHRILKEFTRSNPDYYAARSMGFSTWKIPKKIRLYNRIRVFSKKNLETGAEENKEYDAIIIDRGMWDEFKKLINSINKVSKVKSRPLIKVILKYATSKNHIEVPDPGYTYEDYQQETVDILKREMPMQGIISYPPGGGKTVIGISLVSIFKQRTLILTHTGDLFDQWLTRLQGVYPDLKIGQISSKRKHREGDEITVAMIQSIKSNKDLNKLMRGYGLVIMDECHHSPAESFNKVLRYSPCHHRIGLSASKKRRDRKEFLMHATFGDFISVKSYEDIESRIIYPIVMPVGVTANIDYEDLLREPKVNNKEIEPNLFDYTKAFGDLATDPVRNYMIFNIVEECLKSPDAFILILTKRREQAFMLADFIRGELFKESSSEQVGVIVGGGTIKYKKEKEEMLQKVRDKKMRVLIGTSVADEGLDVVTLNRLILTAPSSFVEMLKQRIGRIMRWHEGKDTPIVYDLVDTNIPEFITAWRSREKFYKKIKGIEIDYSRLDLDNI